MHQGLEQICIVRDLLKIPAAKNPCYRSAASCADLKKQLEAVLDQLLTLMYLAWIPNLRPTDKSSVQ